MAWRAEGSTRIHWAIYDGNTWNEQPVLDQRTGSVPALVSDGNNVYMAWRQDDDDHIEWSVLSGSGWSTPQVLDDRRSASGPALGVLGSGRLVMVWAGAPGDMWWSQFENSQWGPQQGFNDRQMGRGFRATLA